MLKRCLMAVLALFWLSVAAHAACDLNVDGPVAPVKLPGNTLIANINEELGCLDTAISGKQAADADLTSWGAITRASGFDTFAATPSSANMRALLTDESGTGAAYFAGGNAGTPSAITLTNGTGLPIAGITGLGTGIGTWLGTPSSANLRAAVTDEIGAGGLMFGLAPTMANGLGCTASQVVRYNATATAFECATLPGGGDALTSDPLSQFAATTSAQLRGVMSDEVGTGAVMFGLSASMADDLGCTGNQVVRRNAGDTAFECATGGGGGGISAVVDDPAPTLGGNLNLSTFTVGDATATDLTKLNALTATSTELNYVDGVTSAIQTQIDGKQALDSDLTSWAGVTRASGFDAFAGTSSSANLRALLTDESGTGLAYFQGGALGTPASGTATNLTGLPLSTGVTGQLPLANGGTGASLTDPNADRIMFWDDSAGAVTWLTPGSGLSITGTTITATGGGGSADVQTFNSSGTWTKPGSGSVTMLECWGGGGSGGRNSSTAGATGGGGGSYATRVVATSSLGATETVTIGAGGAAITTSSADGNNGGTTTFGSWLSAFGGGGGLNNASGGVGGGGGAGLGSSATLQTGGSVGGASGSGAAVVHASTEGGGAPGGGSNVTAGTVQVGGNAHKGGAGGGAANSAGNTAGGTSVIGGNGGAGNSGSNATAGSQPGGGGGGARNGGSSGAGGAGRCIATTW